MSQDERPRTPSDASTPGGETGSGGETRSTGETGSTADETRSAGGEIRIDAPPDRVWRALTEAADLVRWFPLDAEVEPGEGGSVTLSWRNEFSATSAILEWEPGRHLRTGWGDWHGDGPGQITDYRLEGRGGDTFLRVVTSGLPADASWDEWVEGTRLGWGFELRSLKRYLERHDGLERSVVYLRRRVDLPRREAWDRIVAPDALGWPPVEGEPFDVEPPAQYAATLSEPADALFRLSVEPPAPGGGGRSVVLWLQAWGPAGDRLREIESRWAELLERVYPEGDAA